MTNTNNDYDLRECRNKKCSRRGILVKTDRRYCSVCFAKLKYPPMTSSSDQPPHIDMLTDDELLESLPSFLEFRGNWESYGKYVKSLNVKMFEGLEVWEINEMIRDHHDKNRTGNGKGNGHAKTNVVSITTTPKADDTFTCDEDVKNCPIVTKARIEMPHAMYRLWLYLCKRFDTEWLGYLKGACEDGVWKITEMYFPKQKVQSAHVEAEDGQVIEGTIGSVHSHVGMGAFFSVEDEKHFNHPIEIVVNRAGDVKVALRVKLECGRYGRIEASILLKGTNDEAHAAEALEKMMTQVSSSTSVGSYNRTTSKEYYEHNQSYYHGDGA